MVQELAVPDDYVAVLGELKQQIRRARYRAQRRVNAELISLYWRIGKTLDERTALPTWGEGIINRISLDLRAEFADARGFSPRNLRYMRALARAWPDPEHFRQQPAAELPWGHLMVLLDRLDDPADRDWYASQAATIGWSRAMLEHHIKTRARRRFDAAPTNFDRTLDPGASELAQQLTRDPYLFDFLDVDTDAVERDVEQALVDRIIDTLREFGSGFSFVGRQVAFDVNDDEFFVDLLFFHVEQLRYVVVELKVGKFKPEYAGQLGFYVALVDDRLRRPQHAPTVGLLLCTNKNDQVVRYALAGSTQPVAIASYDLLSPAEQATLPSEADLARALDID
jgi:predicted nuclease of restriction endonuclease-like (RecB) superfamily